MALLNPTVGVAPPSYATFLASLPIISFSGTHERRA
jgi:hypothetical protein